MEQRKEVGDSMEEQAREQYELERRLAERLRNSTKEERRVLYKLVYDELLTTTRHHPQTVGKLEPDKVMRKIDRQCAVVKHFVGRSTIFLEIGAGDCQLSLKVAALVGKAYAIEVSEQLTRGLSHPANFELVTGDACSLGVPSGSVDFAYSNQVMEHLHPDDCSDHLASVHRALVSGGRYLCTTPNRLSGPWDISRHFDFEARGLHLKEYTTSDLANLFEKAGFARVQVYIRARGLHLLLPPSAVTLFEAVLVKLPARTRRMIANWYPFRRVLGISLIGTK